MPAQSHLSQETNKRPGQAGIREKIDFPFFQPVMTSRQGSAGVPTCVGKDEPFSHCDLEGKGPSSSRLHMGPLRELSVETEFSKLEKATGGKTVRV